MPENVVICHYRPRADAVDELLELIREHRRVYRDAGLATDGPEYVYVGHEQRSRDPLVVAIFEWVDAEASAARANTRRSGRSGSAWKPSANRATASRASTSRTSPHPRCST